MPIGDSWRHLRLQGMHTPPRVRGLTLIYNVKEPCLDAEHRAIGDISQYFGDFPLTKNKSTRIV